MANVIIVGGGAAGLAAAFALKRAKDGGNPIEWMLLEKDNRLGGKILTERRDGFIIDGGPDCYLTEKPWVGQMAERLGIADHLLSSDDDKKKTYIYSRGNLHELPDGVWMMVPTKFTPFITSPLFSWPGKIRMGMDLIVPKSRNIDDETVADFVKRRLGTECLEKLAEPMIGGVHASDPYRMSLKATFPRFLQMEQKYGSLIRAFLAARRKAPPPSTKAEAPKRTYFTTFQLGMQEITDGMADAAGRDRLITGAKVVRIKAGGVKPGYIVQTAVGDSYAADAVIVSAEAHLTADIVADLDDQLAASLRSIPWTSAATVSLAYREEQIGQSLCGFGFLVPASEKRKISACTWSSTKWPGRAPAKHALLRAFVGGAQNQHLVDQDDEEMMRMVRSEVRDIMGISGEPAFGRVFRWVYGMPQYTLGHLQRIEQIDSRLRDHAGLFLCGASYRGIGTGDVMNSGEGAAGKAIEFLVGKGIDYAEMASGRETDMPR
ncbi:MAG: protoporphyrinogen oxidase [Chloroflexi bacterium]|nr:protoporphyrinogen oxidase [Chloroflexota bacterium]